MNDHDELFRLGPPRRLARFVHASLPPFGRPVPRVLLVLVLGWLPLLVLTLLPGTAHLRDLGRDIAVHARYAIAAPLLVIAYSSCGRRLGVIAANFAQAGLLDAAGQSELKRQIAISRRLLADPWIEAAAVLLSVAAGLVALRGVANPADLALWARTADGRALSLAGIWQFAVSMPLLLVLLFGWLWRIVIWARLLIHLSRLDINLIASHPDQCGGIGFLGQSLRAFSAFGMALGAISAGRMGHNHLTGTSSSFTDGFLAGGTVAIVALLCVGPLCVFSDRLMQTWRRGSMSYGALATALGTRLEAAWLEREEEPDQAPAGPDDAADGRPPILQAPDFSAAADLFAVVGSVQSMRFVPVDTRSVVMLLLATLLPFVAALFLSMPFDVVLMTLKSLLV